MKGVQEKVSIMGVRGRYKTPSLAITVWHHSASLVMPDSDHRDGFFYLDLPLTRMIDPYIIIIHHPGKPDIGISEVARFRR